MKGKIKFRLVLVVGMLLVAAICLRNVVHLSSILHVPTQVPARNAVLASQRHQQWFRLLQLRRQPDWETSQNGAFIHMGKTGGSTLSLRLRNGCHSFMSKPCREVPLETIASRLIGTYYHVPDFGLIPQGHHSFYVITIRDPLARSISAFVYEHLWNTKARGETMSPLAEEAKTAAAQCFPSLQAFVDAIGDDPANFDYPYHRSQIVTDNCTSLARAVINGKVRRFNHFFFPYQKIRSFIPSDDNSPIIFATRQEHLWYDWKKINYLLGQVGDVIVPSADNNARDMSQVHQPVSRDLSQEGKLRLCHALQSEYDGYVSLLREAINLSDEDVAVSLEEIRQTCPNVIIAPP